jgi:hypothetical protein
MIHIWTTLALAIAAAGAGETVVAQNHDHQQQPTPPPPSPQEHDHSKHQKPEQAPASSAPDHTKHRQKPSPKSQGHDHSQHHHEHEHPPASDAADHSQHHGDAHAAHGQAEHSMAAMTGVLGPYPMAREASGTAWQPDSTRHAMGHVMHGDWMLSGHVMLNAVYDWQDGPRGDEKAFLAGMVMGAAQRDFGGGNVLNLRAMLSPDPFMGGRGYPLLLAAGETADGVTHLVDRQHPHDLLMELAASFSHRIDESDSLFLYVGYPGEPAFGPPAFMHRASASDSPEAPITHHWFDSTHITFGVVTAGWVHETWKAEVSLFTGREPDDDRYDFDEATFDSVSLRASWNPNPNWSFQASWADLESPEQLEPDEDQTRWSASAIYNVPLADEGWWATTLIVGERHGDHHGSELALALESAYAPDRDWTFFARAETIETSELGVDDQTVGKIAFGAIRDFYLSDNVKVGVGALYSVNFVGDDLEPSYDGDPDGAMIFLRLAAAT